MTADKKTVAVYDAKASEYQSRFGKTEPDGDLSRFIEALPEGAHVLDLGCGPGTAAQILQEAGFKVDAMDASQSMVDLARARGIDARCATFDTLQDVARFDGVWANFSLLHAPRADMPGHLAAIHRALRAGGVLHLGLKIGDGEARDAMGRKYTFFSEAELRKLLGAAGFTVTHIRHGEEAGFAGTVDPFIIILAHG